MRRLVPMVPFSQIEEIRLRLGRTQTQFVKLINYSIPSYSHWKRNDCCPARALAAAEALIIIPQPMPKPRNGIAHSDYRRYPWAAFLKPDIEMDIEIGSTSPKSIRNCAKGYAKRAGVQVTTRKHETHITIRRTV